MSPLFNRVIDTRAQWGPRVAQLFKRLFLIVVGGIGVFGITAMILWDADFYIARERWEGFKHAMFGDWAQIKSCELMDESEQRDCGLSAVFNEVIDGKRDFHFFHFEALPDTPYFIATGKRYATINDLIDGTPTEIWCFLQDQSQGVRRVIDLVNQQVNGETIHTDEVTLALYPLADMKLTIPQLQKATKAYCQIDLTNARTESKKI